MYRVWKFIVHINRTYPKLTSVFVALIVLWIDIITDKEIHFPLVYVIPVGLIAWQRQRIPAYVMAVILPILRIGYEFPWGSRAALGVFGLNALIEIAAMVLYAFLVGRISIQTGQLKKTVTTKEFEIDQIRAFTRITGTTIQGRGLSPGMAEGVALIYHPYEYGFYSAPQPIGQKDVETEIDKLDSALKAAIHELHDTQTQFSGNMAVAESALLGVQLAMLNDPGFWEKCKERIRGELIKAEQSVAEEVWKMAAKLEVLEQEILRERGTDIRDIGLRVLRNIRSSRETMRNRLTLLPPHTILVVKELLPSDMLQIDHINLAALVLERNSPASHVAILARTRNIPVVSDIKDAVSLLSTGDRLLVDADTGSVTVAPTRVQEELFTERQSQYATRSLASAQDQVLESITKDGIPIGLYANISRPDEAYMVREYHLQGVGLFRSEFLFLDVAQPPTLDMQIMAYSAVAKMLNPNPVIIRTMDFGGDKVPKFNRNESALVFRTGKRGLAFSLSEKTMFRTQIQAILRSSQAGDIRIMFPMVMGVADLKEARNIISEVAESERLDNLIPIGAMIETPAAVIHFREIVKMVDFISIGTNDLAHFILATDRQSQGSQSEPAFLHPSVLRATQHVIRIALEQGIGLSVCGEAAGDPASVCLLIGMGVRNLSLNPFRAAGVRRFLQQMTLEKMERLAKEALGFTTLDEVMHVMSNLIHDFETGYPKPSSPAYEVQVEGLSL
jgi:phosphoenolpyruvate-protein phosphotransferase (PTS system enzyme I)